MSKLTQLKTSPATKAKLMALHKIVKASVMYRRIWSDKRLTQSAKNTVYGHRVKYHHCDPSATALDSINRGLAKLNLIAKRYNSKEHCGMHLRIVKCLVIERISLEEELINTFTL